MSSHDEFGLLAPSLEFASVGELVTMESGGRVQCMSLSVLSIDCGVNIGEQECVSASSSKSESLSLV